MSLKASEGFSYPINNTSWPEMPRGGKTWEKWCAARDWDIFEYHIWPYMTHISTRIFSAPESFSRHFFILNTDRKHRAKTQRENTQRENTERKHREKTHRQQAHRQKAQTENTQTENTHRKHTQKTHAEKHTERKHRPKTQRENTWRENTGRKRAEKTHRKHRQKTHRRKTQRENTDRKHTDRKHRQKTHREKTQTENTQTENTDRKHTDRKHRQKTQRENTDRKHRQKTHRKQRQKTQISGHWSGVGSQDYSSTPRRGRESSPGPPASKATALSGRQIFWDDHIRKIVIANTLRGAIPRDQNSRFATVSRDRPTESYERVHPAKSKCAFCYSGVPSKISKCTFRYNGAHKNVWNERMASAAYKNHRFTTASDVRPARSDERAVAPSTEKFEFHHSFGSPTSASDEKVARAPSNFAFHHSFGHPTSTKWREGCFGNVKNCISRQFWASDEHEVTRGLLRQRENFSAVLGIRWARSDERVASATWQFAFHHSFGHPIARSDEWVVSRRDLPNLPCDKKRRKF